MAMLANQPEKASAALDRARQIGRSLKAGPHSELAQQIGELEESLEKTRSQSAHP
jgi:hypothetical protein